MTSFNTLAPNLTLLSHTTLKDTIDIMANSSLHLKCTGNKPMYWQFPNNNPQYDPVSKVAQIRSKCDDNSVHNKCVTDVVISEVTYEMTGYFTCLYNESTQLSDSIYVFVNDPEYLIVPYEGNYDFMFIAVFQSQPATIPCKPTNSRAKVSLWKVHTNSGIPQEIQVNSTLGITYNQKKGYHFEYPRWDGETSLLECKVELDTIEMISQISIHWSILPVELHPLIDDSRAKNVFTNSTFTLKCFVHIELGVIIVITWDVPNKNSLGRIAESLAETQRIEVNGNSYDTVSKNITISDVQIEDEGVYHCNVTDGNGRVFSASKKITVYENGLPPSYFNFSMDIDNEKPLISKVGEMVRFVVDVLSFPDFESVHLFWYKNNMLIEKTHKHYETGVSSNGQYSQTYLEIKTIELEDSGTYILMGNTSDMTTNITMTLLVSGSPAIKMLNSLEFYEINKAYELECLAIGYPKALVWWKWFTCLSPDNCSPSDDEHQWIAVNNFTNNSLLMNSELLIAPNISSLYLSPLSLQVIANQTGGYRCYASNDNITIIQNQISFIVTDAINGFSIQSSTDEPTVREDITLTCKASVYNYTKLNWIRRPLNYKIIDTNDIDVVHNISGLIYSSLIDEYSITLSIQIKLAQINDSGVYVCEAITRDTHTKHEIEFKLDIQNVSAPVLIESNLKDNMIEKTPYTQFELRCMVRGRPKPIVNWYRNKKPFIVSENTGIILEDRNQRLIFTRILDKDSGLYECEAHNSGGSVKRSARLKVDSLEETNTGVSTEEIIVFVLFVLVGTVMIFMAIYIGKKIRQERKAKREMDFLSHNLFETGQIEMYNPDLPLDEQIELLPYDPRYEFPKERLKLGRTLGQGAFGRVVKAEAIGLEDSETSSTVAVKMLKERADINQRKALMAELKILIHLGRHLNIVNLLGAVTKNLVKGELLVIVEYCKYGNLRHYLLAYRDSFVNQLNPKTDLIDPSIKTVQDIKKHNSCYQNSQNGKTIVYENVFAANGIANPNYTTSQITCIINPKKESVRYADIMHNQQTGSYTNGYITSVSSSNQETGHDSSSANGSSGGYRGESIHKRNKDKIVTTCDLLCYAFQCARGMQYLAHRKLIHRDLAARNVLLAEDNIVKICDFGLAKDVYKYDNYVKKNDGPLPIKWMAIESIRDKVFTSKSDVWSFGILLYEFFTLGGNPYPGIEIDEEFYKRLKSGYRMEKPDFAPKEIYELMTHCWSAEPKERPDFMEIADFIGALLESNVRQHYLDLNDPYQKINEQILNNNDYLRMSSMNSSSRNEINNDYLNMKFNETDETDNKSEPMSHYDNLGHIRPVDNNSPIPFVPMEVVPMIQLDSFGQRYDEQNRWLTCESHNSDYLSMENCMAVKNGNYSQAIQHYTNDSSDACIPPPPYSHVT
ncbi:vascular endothelial growth factor receptor 1-like [Oppia nitens]|uniref:vascular endothelial growth factor receptor 1-like n=1 Tax=Oppia nitens TaxID=1686743 RepID=UPI0023D9AEB2|nr:vascular endothelial growth factor receptor 1-like [Oppia nitens]